MDDPKKRILKGDYRLAGKLLRSYGCNGRSEEEDTERKDGLPRTYQGIAVAMDDPKKRILKASWYRTIPKLCRAVAMDDPKKRILKVLEASGFRILCHHVAMDDPKKRILKDEA